MRNTLKRLVVRLILGRKKEIYELVSLKGHFYVLNIRPFVSADRLINRWEKALQKCQL